MPSRLEKESFAKRVIHYHINVAKNNKKVTMRHFRTEGAAKSSVYGVIQRYEETGEINYKPISGRPVVKSSPSNVKAVEEAFKRKPDSTVLEVASKLNLSRATVSKIRVDKLGIKARTRKKCPKFVKDQESRAKTGLPKICKRMSSTSKGSESEGSEEVECFLCYEKTTIEVETKNIENELLNKELTIFFLVNRILKVSSTTCTKFFEKNGNPSDWFHCCVSCNCMVRDAEIICKQLTELQKKQKSLLERIENFILRGHKKDALKYDQDQISESEEVDNVSRSIRKEVALRKYGFQDDNRLLENDEENLVKIEDTFKPEPLDAEEEDFDSAYCPPSPDEDEQNGESKGVQAAPKPEPDYISFDEEGSNSSSEDGELPRDPDWNMEDYEPAVRKIEPEKKQFIITSEEYNPESFNLSETRVFTPEIIPRKMSSRKENESFSKSVIHYYENVAQKNKISTVRHFREEGRHKNTIYNIIRRFEESGTVMYKPLSGRPPVKSSPAKVKAVEEEFRITPTASVRTVATKLNLSRQTVSRIKVKKLGITARTRKTL